MDTLKAIVRARRGKTLTQLNLINGVWEYAVPTWLHRCLEEYFPSKSSYYTAVAWIHDHQLSENAIGTLFNGLDGWRRLLGHRSPKLEFELLNKLILFCKDFGNGTTERLGS